MQMMASLSARDARPLGSHVLVQPMYVEKSGFELTEAARNRQPTMAGAVVAVGPGGIDPDRDERVPMWAREGSKVLFRSFRAERLQLDGDEDYAMVFDEDILLACDAHEALSVPPEKVLLRRVEDDEPGKFLVAGRPADPGMETFTGEVAAVADSNEHLLGVGDLVRCRRGTQVDLEQVCSADRLKKGEYLVADAASCLARWPSSR